MCLSFRGEILKECEKRLEGYGGLYMSSLLQKVREISVCLCSVSYREWIATYQLISTVSLPSQNKVSDARASLIQAKYCFSPAPR